ncbi:response regulator transcription factor [Granulosicoccus antarcticus]|uniref:Transcriptional regulatory protein QseB n=1 Tax=Granulosicoccus antarcticus IMCC3135 TaxID=1192854 RepID=A0A2Z2P0P6_9GAMM|nr:response regulator transcription factor [Granulosicoccus antarcticus]ASJ76325.1 Transcriptional regulatory protein QseB [Granulosicoccus antarcticus IMCC3135]
MRILLVEDDPLIGHGVSQSLLEANHTCQWVKDGKAVMPALEGDTFDAVLLDLGLPGMDGTSVLRQMRERGKDIPVIIITARDGEQDRIQGLDLGADDYLVKPFSLGELQARLRAVARRHVGSGSPQLVTANLQLDPAAASARGEFGDVSLSAREMALLQAMMYRPGQVFSREQLESHVYSQGEEVASNALEVVIHGLRKKLGKQAIRNIRGLGWMVEK